MSRSILLTSETLSPMQQDCVDMLRELLAHAEAGKVHTVGVVVCMDNGYATTMAGTRAAELNLGCDSLKKKILAEIEKPAIMKFK
jgi:hypothetical protein